MTFIAVYLAIFLISMVVVGWIRRRKRLMDFTSLKTVTFGDESTVRPDRAASVISVVAIVVIWAAFTGSSLLPFHVPGPFIGTTDFRYTAVNGLGEQDEGTVTVAVFGGNDEAVTPQAGPTDGFAVNDAIAMPARRSSLIKVAENDLGGDDPQYKIMAINGAPIQPGLSLPVANGDVTLTQRGSLLFAPYAGMQMEPIWLPAPEAVWARFVSIAQDGYQNSSLWQHIGSSVFRVVAGFLLGSLVGIPLGYAMGLSGWFRGWFDPIVEFMRPVPPLAMIPLIIIWFGIWETGKVVLLFLAALWIMVIAARSGVSGVRVSKIHAAYSLGASKWQILCNVIVPNSLSEIFTGARVAMGVCWGTVVAAELVAAQRGAGMMILVASKFQLTDIVVMGIIIIGIIGYLFDISMRVAERTLVPWKGRG
jgi:taurine transport system permease protein